MGHKKRAKMQGTPSNAKKGILTRVERVRLMAETLCDERTIRRWERGEAVREPTRERLTKAARKLDIIVPEPS
ncbi:MAG: hypothetical protein ACYDC2_03270 [Solirubrobacteraceae bacterium]